MVIDRTIAVAMSGGVDSAVAAYLLKERFSRVFAVSHYIWPDSVCCAPAALDRARAVCRDLGIPYQVLDMTEEFSTLVVDDFVQAYRDGITPNPCVRCNERVRFSGFYQRVVELCRSMDLCSPEERPRFATGHYVRLTPAPGGPLLTRARDRTKDQSYMLYRIPTDLLPFLEFPLGEMRKAEVVEIAREFGFPVNETEESQDVCFIDGPYTDFIASRVGREDVPGEGYIQDSFGRILGRHRGYLHYTVGQRKGLGLSDGPWYVLGLNPEGNRVIVGREDELPVESCEVTEPLWHRKPEGEELRCNVMLRYNAPEIPCTVRILPEDKLEVLLDTPAPATGGQSAVFYRDDCILGGGIISPKRWLP